MGSLNRVYHKRAAKHRRADGFFPTATFAGMDPTTTNGVDTNTPSNTPPAPVTTTSRSSAPPPPPPTTTTNTPPPPPPTTTTPTDTDTTTNQPPPTNIVLPPSVDDEPSTTAIVTTPLPRPTGGQSTVVLVTTSQPTRSIAPSETSGVSEPKSESNSNVGGIIGGIAGGLLGLVVIIFAIRYLLRRRSRQSEADGGVFNSSDFRRSAVLMNDPPTHEDIVSAGFNPRPPTMIERRLASPAPAFGTQHGAPGPHYFDGHNGQDYGATDQYGQQYQSFAPGQVMHQNNMSPPQSATSANPLYPNAAYAQSPFSPIGTPVYEGGFDDRAGASPYLTRQPSNGNQLNRQPSYGQDVPAQYANYPGQAPQAAQGYPAADYVDLARSSVSPYQAAQYAEISKKLNTDIPAGLDTPAVAQFVQAGNRADVSPFADPGSPMAPQTPQGRGSVESAQEFNFPAPPSPAYTNSSRIDSTPPMLPEITVESRVSVTSYDFPNSVRASADPHSPMGSGYPSGAAAATGGLYAAQAQYPATPSPLASSFVIDTPPVGKTFDSAPLPSPRVSAVPKPETRPETVYDAEDAYGGI